MAKITKVVGARYEETDPIFKQFIETMEGHGVSQSTLIKLIFKYALMEHIDDFEKWIETKTIVIN